MGYTHLDPGRELEISSHIYFSSSQSDLSELVKLSPDALKEQEQASVDQEKAIYAEILKVSEKWVQQAMKTCELRKAQQYLTIPPTPHTANVWIDGEYDWHEISNMVYKMSWRVYENTRYDKAKKESVPVSWEISWYLTFNTPREPDYSGPGPSKSPVRTGNALPTRRRWKSTSKAVSTPTPTCSPNSPRPSPRGRNAAFPSTVSFSPATPWKSRRKRPRRLPMNCWAFWRTGIRPRHRQSRKSPNINIPAAQPIRSPSPASKGLRPDTVDSGSRWRRCPRKHGHFDCKMPLG